VLGELQGILLEDKYIYLVKERKKIPGAKKEKLVKRGMPSPITPDHATRSLGPPASNGARNPIRHGCAARQTISTAL
jgi:hypothetical protein